MQITQEYLKELFAYDNGNLIWKIKKSNNTKVNSLAGSLKTCKGKKYWSICVDNKHFGAHRLIYCWHHGCMPENEIDHIDGNGLNNKIENLREATRIENAKNLQKYSRNTSGTTGVSFHKETNKWVAYIQVNKKMMYLGEYKEIKDAIDVRKNAEKTYFKQWARK
jgi:hypothetical protein